MNFRKVCFVLWVSTLLLSLGACQKHEEASQPADHPASEAAAPTEQVAAEGSQLVFPLTGKVAEIHHGSGYSYILLDTDSGQHWVATMQNVMQNFPSKALDRTFDSIIFSSQVIGQTGAGHHPGLSDESVGAEKSGGDSFVDALKQEQVTPGAGDMPKDSSQMGSSKAVMPSASDIQVAKAQGNNAYTVSELFGKSAELTGKTILLQAKVVKISPSIMGKNWLHVQDGSGDPMKNTHDLVVTTMALPNQGDVITLEGTLNTDRDFGYGYVYAVLVEDAVIK